MKSSDEEIAEKASAVNLLTAHYVCSSTGSLELARTQDDHSAFTFNFERQHHKEEDRATFVDTCKRVISKKWKKCSVKRTLSKNFPTLSTINRYKVREYLLNDMVAGFTAGITMIPQGMAFASLSTLPPIVGLYISLFASLTYFLLGTSHQLSWGCVAVLSILFGNILDAYEAKVKAEFGFVESDLQYANTSLAPPTTTFDVLNSTSSTEITDLLQEALSSHRKIEVVGAVTLISGVILATLGKLGLGRLTTLMSDTLITSFTIGVSVHVITSQIKTALDLNIPRQSGIFKLIYTWVAMLENIHYANPATLIISLICIVILYVVKRFVNEKYKTKLRAPVPIELFVVIVVTIITTYTGLTDKYSVSVVEDVPVGVPSPRIPDLSLGTDYVIEGLVIIIVSFTQNIAMAKMMGLKHNYRIDSNQEMFACGIVSVVCSFFSGYISGPSVSRSLVQDGAGGKTQVASLFAAALVFMVIMLIGPYFYYLPKCVLSAIIIVNLRSIFMKITTVPEMWRKSWPDALVWIITCVCTVFLDTDIGLLAGIVTCILLVLFRSQRNTVDVVAEFSDGDDHVWRSECIYFGGNTFHGVKVIKINSALYFANAEIMTDEVFKKTGINPVKIAKTNSIQIKVETAANAEKAMKNVSEKSGDHLTLGSRSEPQNGTLVTNKNRRKEYDDSVNSRSKVDNGISNSVESVVDSKVLIQSIIVELSSVPFVDIMGVQALEFLMTKYQAVGISVYFANAQEKCVETLQKTGFLSKYRDFIFVTTEAAMRYIQAQEVGQNSSEFSLA